MNTDKYKNVRVPPPKSVKKADKLYMYKDLVKDISASSGYAEYEVKDVLEHFFWCTGEALRSQDRPVELKGFGLLKKHLWKAREVKSNLTGEILQVKDRYHINFHTNSKLKNHVNDVQDES